MSRFLLVGTIAGYAFVAAGCFGNFLPEGSTGRVTALCGEAECDDEVLCTEDLCEDGICTHLPDDSRCAAGESCNPVAGCLGETHPLSGLEVSVDYPWLIDDTLPTYLSHLIAHSAGDGGIGPLAVVTLTNGSPTATLSAEVEVTLVGFSSPNSQTAVLDPGASTTLDLRPPLDVGALFDLTDTRMASIRTVVRSEGDLIWEETVPAALSSRNTALLVSERYLPYLSVFVTPEDESGAVAELVAEARRLRPAAPLHGYGPALFRHDAAVSPGNYWYRWLYLVAGETVTISVESTSAAYDNHIYLVSAADAESIWSYEGVTGRECELHNPLAGEEVRCAPAESGSYYTIFHNNTEYQWDLQATHTMTGEEVVRAHFEALHAALEARGTRFREVAPGFLRHDWQEMGYPAETYLARGGNCFDGSILIAAALEAMGLNPRLELTSDHAMIAATMSPTSDYVATLETTMISRDGSDFYDAYNEGWERAATENGAGNLMYVDVAEARGEGVLPAPL